MRTWYAIVAHLQVSSWNTDSRSSAAELWKTSVLRRGKGNQRNDHVPDRPPLIIQTRNILTALSELGTNTTLTTSCFCVGHHSPHYPKLGTPTISSSSRRRRCRCSLTMRLCALSGDWCLHDETEPSKAWVRLNRVRHAERHGTQLEIRPEWAALCSSRAALQTSRAASAFIAAIPSPTIRSGQAECE